MFIPISLFLFVLLFYLRTLCATFNINDSGETIMDCDLLAIAHSPGYPLHTLLGRIACLLPLGQPMFRLTFLSAVMGAFAAAMVYLILRKVLKNLTPQAGPGTGLTWMFLEIPSVFGALLFAFSFQHWFQSCGAKGSIYSLNTLFTVLTLFVLLKMREEGWFLRGLWLSALLFGMALSVHWETQAVLVPAYLWFLLSAQKKILLVEMIRGVLRPFEYGMNLRRLLGSFGRLGLIRAAVFLILPLSTYLFLPLRAAQGPIVNWCNPRTLKNFFFVVMRGNYQGTGDPRSFITVTRNLERFWFHARHQYGDGFTVLILLLSLAGLVWFYRKAKTDALGFLWLGLGVFAGAVVYNNPKAGYEWLLDNFYTPVFLSLALLGGMGSAWLVSRCSSLKPAFGVRPALGAVFLLLAFLPLGLNYKGNDQSAYTVSYDEGMNLLKTTDRGGVILCNGDIDILPLWYLQFVAGKRPDTASFTTALVSEGWYRDDISRRWPFLKISLGGRVSPETVVGEMIHSCSKDRPFYTTTIYPQGIQWLFSEYRVIPQGLLLKLAVDPAKEAPFAARRADQFWSTYHLSNLNPPQRKYWDEYTDVMKDSYGQACSFTGDFAMASRMPELAKWNYEMALSYRQPQAMGVTYLKLGDSEMALGRGAEAIQHYQESLRWEPKSPGVPYYYAPDAYARMGYAYLLEKDFSNAEIAFRTSLGINPRQKEALEGLSRLDVLRNSTKTTS